MIHPKAQQSMKNLGLTQEEYKDFLEELRLVIKNLLVDATNAITKDEKLKATDALHSMKGSVGALGLMDSYVKCQALEVEFKKNIPENSLVLINDLIMIYENEINEIVFTL